MKTLSSLMLAMPWALACAGGTVQAHPHVFIDTDFSLVFDEEGELSAVKIEWTYDDFYSLLMIEDNGLDADGDGTPEQDRLDAYAGRDVDWAAGFPGDFTLQKGGEPVELAPPVQHEVRYRDGRIMTSHVRPLMAPVPVDGAGIVARSYDPTYFVAYEVPNDPTVSGRDDCRLARDAADQDRAWREAGEKLAAVDMSGDPFEVVELDDIGILFADAFILTCDAPS